MRYTAYVIALMAMACLAALDLIEDDRIVAGLYGVVAVLVIHLLLFLPKTGSTLTGLPEEDPKPPRYCEHAVEALLAEADITLRALSQWVDDDYLKDLRKAVAQVESGQLELETDAPNRYGLDVPYLRRNLRTILLELEDYTPGKAAAVLARLSFAVDPDIEKMRGHDQ